MTGDKMDDILEAKAAKIETNNDTESTSLSWSSFKQDFDQVFGMATNLLLHPEFRADKLALAKQQEDTASSAAMTILKRLRSGKRSCLPMARIARTHECRNSLRFTR